MTSNPPEGWSPDPRPRPGGAHRSGEQQPWPGGQQARPEGQQPWPGDQQQPWSGEQPQYGYQQPYSAPAPWTDAPSQPPQGYSPPEPVYGLPQQATPYGQPGGDGGPYAQQQYQQQPYQQQPYQQQPYEQQPAAKPKRTRLLLASSAAVVVLAAGGVATYAAVSDSGSGGSSTPQAAVQTALTDLDHSDLIGLLADLPPGERDALVKPVTQTISQLKRNDVLAGNADPSNVSGVQFSATGITYAPGTVTVSDHEQIVEITGGTITFNGDAAKLPLSQDFLNAVVPGGLHDSTSTTVNIAQELARTHRTAVRIATEKVGGSWYPSLFYTIADNATYQRGLPTAADAIPAQGASSPDGVVTSLLQDVAAGNGAGLIGLVSPSELQVVHDYGRLIVPNTQFRSPLAGAQISGLSFDTSSLGGGDMLVVTKSATITINGRTITTTRTGDCYSVSVNGQSKQFCAGAQGANSIAGLITGITGNSLTPRQSAALSDAFSSLSKLGIVVSQSGGQWYVDPVRTVLDIVPTLLSGLKPGDLLALASLAHH